MTTCTHNTSEYTTGEVEEKQKLYPAPPVTDKEYKKRWMSITEPFRSHSSSTILDAQSPRAWRLPRCPGPVAATELPHPSKTVLGLRVCCHGQLISTTPHTLLIVLLQSRRTSCPLGGLQPPHSTLPALTHPWQRLQQYTTRTHNTDYNAIHSNSHVFSFLFTV